VDLYVVDASDDSCTGKCFNCTSRGTFSVNCKGIDLPLNRYGIKIFQVLFIL
jgi:hypothetical protein